MDDRLLHHCPDRYRVRFGSQRLKKEKTLTLKIEELIFLPTTKSLFSHRYRQNHSFSLTPPAHQKLRLSPCIWSWPHYFRGKNHSLSTRSSSITLLSTPIPALFHSHRNMEDRVFTGGVIVTNCCRACSRQSKKLKIMPRLLPSIKKLKILPHPNTRATPRWIFKFTCRQVDKKGVKKQMWRRPS